MTRGEMTTRIQQWLGLQSIDAFNEVPLIQDMVYRGVIDLLARTRCVARCVHLHTQANVSTYTLDHSILSLVDVEDGATARARRNQTGAAAASNFPATVIYPTGYWDPTPPTFTLIRSDVLRLHPTPAQAGEVDVWAVLRPQKMGADTDSPGDENFGAIPEEFQDAIELYALWRCADYTDDSSSQVGERYRLLYEGSDGSGGRLREIRKLVNKRGTARGAPRRMNGLSNMGDRRTWVG
jgi:hypothetical protein